MQEGVLPIRLVVMIKFVENVLNTFRVFTARGHSRPWFGHPNTRLCDIQGLQVAVGTEETVVAVIALGLEAGEL